MKLKGLSLSLLFLTNSLYADNPCGVACTRALIAAATSITQQDWSAIAGNTKALRNGTIAKCSGDNQAICNKMRTTIGDSSLFTQVPFSSGVPTFIQRITIPANMANLHFEFTNTGTSYISCRITSESGGMFLNSGAVDSADPQNSAQNVNPNLKVLLAPNGQPGQQIEKIRVMNLFQAFAKSTDFYAVCTSDNTSVRPSVSVVPQYV